ncbi:uncharacterized protein LOC131657469 [Vicia villosa]|uniref:uncharacterized protein LOC131657469 n=1 Tax=Vicia villosa TaxID=3911 RepID=UPI00273A9950|nr:uncharacterized protein LOC131657469 [Vicia villosa]
MAPWSGGWTIWSDGGVASCSGLWFDLFFKPKEAWPVRGSEGTRESDENMASPSKAASPGNKASSEESPLKTASNALVVESHNSSPDNIPPKDDAGTATSGFKDPGLTIDVDKLYSTSQNQTHVLSPVFEDVRPIATILPNEPVEESHSTDESPPTHQGKNLEEDHPFSGSDNVNQQSHDNEDSASEKDAMEEISQPEKPVSQGTSTLDAKTIPETTSTPAPAKLTPSELEQLKQTDPLGFLKAIMNANTPSPQELNVSPAVTTDSSDKEDIPSLLRQIKERFFGVNLVDVLNREPIKSHNLNQLLKKVDLLQVSTEVSEVIVLLGSLLEQLQANILRKQNVEKELSETVALS